MWIVFIRKKEESMTSMDVTGSTSGAIQNMPGRRVIAYSLKGDPSAAIVEIIINILTFSLGIIGLVWAWRAFRRRV